MKFFISHSSKNFKYGEAIVQLLMDVGMPQKNIIFTSKVGYGIPKGKDIFKWLKSEIKERPFVIYLLSEEYYSSIACLNEMGAAWIIENEHIALFTPGFNPGNPKFWDGAIEPRELGIFVDDKDDVFEFVEIVINKLGNNVKPIIIDQAITKYLKSVEDIKRNIENDKSEKKMEVNNDKQDGKRDLIETLSADSIPQSKSTINTSNDSPYEKFKEDIQKGKLADEELLLIKYLVDMGKDVLGDRWMTDGEIENIKQWEDENDLDNYLSENYIKALGKFKIRKFIKVYSTTSYGNPREYTLIEEISNHLLDFPEDIINILNKMVNRHQAPYNISSELPF
ncbi:hypothetical protein KK120_14915 [Virgibacillus dakarensis]|nr:hypothetical protein [Virgibacillus dakarensis]